MDFEALCKRYEVEGPRPAIRLMIKQGHRHSVVKDAVEAWNNTLEAPEVKESSVEIKNLPRQQAKKPAKALTPEMPVSTDSSTPVGLIEYYNPTKWPEINTSKLSPFLRKEYDEANKRFVECKRLHSGLPEYKDDEERRKAALTIVEGMNKNALTRARCRFFIDNGKLPEVKPEETLDETDAIAVYEALRNVRTYVTRYKNKPEKAELYKQYNLRKEYLTKVYDELKRVKQT